MGNLHFNCAPTKWGHSPLAPAGALIPLCESEGDQPEDAYTLDPTKVTCIGCRRAMREAWEKADDRAHAVREAEREREFRDRMLTGLVERRAACPVTAMVAGWMDGASARMDAAGIPKART